MDVILHLGSHRTGSTTFQSYMRRSTAQLLDRGVGSWGPVRTRHGLFAGLLPGPSLTTLRDVQRRAQGRVQMELTRVAQSGVRKLLVSDQDMIGSVRDNLRNRSLYPMIGERMAHFARAFGERATRVVLNIRSQDLVWTSAISYDVSRGYGVLPPKELARIAGSHRTWRNVISDLSCALPDAEILVLSFERYQGRPDEMLSACLDEKAPVNKDIEWLNRAPDVRGLRKILIERDDVAGLQAMDSVSDGTRWHPFTHEQRAALREAYEDDMHWLMSGADGLATLTEPAMSNHMALQNILTRDSDQIGTGNIPHFGPLNRGLGHDKQERHVAGHR